MMKPKKRKDGWTEAEDALMREHYRSCSTARMREMLPARSRKAINLRACTLGLTQPDDWTQEQDAAVREHYTAMGAAAVGQMIGRSVLAVRSRAVKLGVKADKHRPMPQRAKKTRPEKATKVVIRARKPWPGVAIKPAAPMRGEPIITSETRVTLCPHGRDRRYTAEHAPRVVDSADCRDWARALA